MATEKTGPFVVVKDLSKRFGPDWAFARASFSLERGTLGLLTGVNGSGKTTLLRCLATALVPDFGQASIGGNDLVSKRDEVRRLVSSLSHPLGFYGGLSARENLRLTDALLPPRTSSVDSVLNLVGLGSRSDVPLDAFSAGMKQRFALARLAFLERDLVLLDEPETHLDSSGFGLVRDLIREWKAKGIAILCATHAPERFDPIADLEVRMDKAHAGSAGAHS